MIFLQYPVVGDEAGDLIEQEADLFVLLPGSVGGGFGAIAFFARDHFADELNCRVVLIPVFTRFCFDHIFLQHGIRLGEVDGLAAGGQVTDGKGDGLITLVAEDEVGGVVVNPDAELAFGVGDDAVMAVPYRDADVCQGDVRA